MAVVTTTKGDMDDSMLEKREGTVDNDNELTTWGGILVGRRTCPPFCTCDFEKNAAYWR